MKNSNKAVACLCNIVAAIFFWVAIDSIASEQVAVSLVISLFLILAMIIIIADDISEKIKNLKQD